jgi:CRISPR/Cas system-associated exonuclease Cas4 (RecB family)
MYKLSPSDFAYLYEECKCCYYLKIKHGIYRPSSPFPAVFGAINSLLQGVLIGKDLRTLNPILPEGIVESQEGFIESKQVPGTNVYVRGKYDLLVRRPNGEYLIVDFKISKPDEEKIAKYKTQLQAYHYAFEFPAEGKPKFITKLGLIIVYPDSVKFENGIAAINFPPQWMEIEIKRDRFLEFMKEVNKLLEGPVPPEDPNCQHCKYRHLGESASHNA